jgi:hypothetical protein
MKTTAQSKMFEYMNGDKDWRRGNVLHRADGPAIEYVDGDKAWYLHGVRHRADGPAVEFAAGDTRWWLSGKILSFDAWLERTTGLTEEQKVMMKLQYG